MDTLGKSHAYVPEIQGLRAVAVILVILFHSELDILPGGFIGVDVFFVISGFLITGLLLKEFDQTQTINLSQFYARRIRRLLPAATAVVLTTTIAAWVVYSPLELKIYSSSAIATVVYLSNVWFASLSTDYLAEDTHTNPLLHTWSLSVEEQFYLVWPLLILMMASRFSGFSRHRNLISGLWVLCIASFSASFLVTEYSQPWAFFGSPTRAWEFGAGGLVAIWINGGRRFASGTGALLSLTGLSLLFLASALFTTQTPFPGFAALIPVTGSCLLIISAYTESPSLRYNAWLNTRPIQLIGDMSYSLYLWHWPVFVFLRMLAPEFGMTEKIAGIVLSTTLAWITYHWIENPFRHGNFFSKGSFRSFSLGGALLALSVALVFLVRVISANELSSPAQQRYLAANADIPRIYNDKCHAQFTQEDFPECVYGSKTASRTMVLFGDSHAAHWFPAIEEIAKQNDYRLISLTKSSCPSIIFEPYLTNLNRPYTECSKWRENVFRLIEDVKPDVTVMSNYNKHILRAGGPEIWKTGLKSTLSRLEHHSSRNVIINDTPELGFNPGACLSRAAWKRLDAASECVFPRSDKLARTSMHIEQAALASIKNGALVDMTDTICPSEPCVVEAQDMVLFKDQHHLSATFSRHMAAALYNKLQPYLKKDIPLSLSVEKPRQ